MGDEEILCICHNITTGKVQNAFEAGARSFEEIQRVTNCAEGCGACTEAIKDYIKFLKIERSVDNAHLQVTCEAGLKTTSE